MPPTSNIQGNKCDTINGQNMPIQTQKHEYNSKSDKYKGLSQGNWTVSLTVYIHTVFSLYAIYRYLANLHSILPRIFCRYRMCSHRKPKISIFVQMAPIIIITMHWRPQISWRSILQRRAQRSHQQNTTEMSFCSIRVLMLEYSIHNTKKKQKKAGEFYWNTVPAFYFPSHVHSGRYLHFN